MKPVRFGAQLFFGGNRRQALAIHLFIYCGDSLQGFPSSFLCFRIPAGFAHQEGNKNQGEGYASLYLRGN